MQNPFNRLLIQRWSVFSIILGVLFQGVAYGEELDIPEQHSRTEFYIEGSNKTPVTIFGRKLSDIKAKNQIKIRNKKNKEKNREKIKYVDSLEKREVLCKQTGLDRTHEPILVSSSDVRTKNAIVSVETWSSSCKEYSGYVRASQVRQVDYHFHFGDKSGIKIKPPELKEVKRITKYILLPKYYNRVKIFREAKGKIKYSIEGFHAAYFQITVFKDDMSLIFKIHSYNKLDVNDCGCSNFMLVWAKPSKGENMKSIETIIRNYDENGKLSLIDN